MTPLDDLFPYEILWREQVLGNATVPCRGLFRNLIGGESSLRKVLRGLSMRWADGKSRVNLSGLDMEAGLSGSAGCYEGHLSTDLRGEGAWEGIVRGPRT